MVFLKTVVLRIWSELVWFDELDGSILFYTGPTENHSFSRTFFSLEPTNKM